LRQSNNQVDALKDFALMATALLPAAAPFVLPYEGTEPHFSSEPRLSGIGSCVVGKVQIGARASLAAGSVIRADGHIVRIGDDFHLGEISTVHIAHKIYPTIIGDRVTVGRNAVVHACVVGDNCVIEDDVVVLDGSSIQAGVLIEAGSTVFPRSTLMTGLIYGGNPAKPARDLGCGERADREARLHAATTASLFSSTCKRAGAGHDFQDDVYIAKTAWLTGRIEMGRRSSVFFGCRLDAGEASIVIGENTNIQDNCRIRCGAGDVIIGPNTTIGHNVQISACNIGQRTLVGIGSTVSPGTIIEDDVLVAAGSTTSEGQYLGRGWMWGGRPARPISTLDDTKRSMMAAIIDHYYAYGQAYRCAQNRLTRE
jgi:carbonic anhydrase/acetyltransferase-like protein (isoleucine patch superfamily)